MVIIGHKNGEIDGAEDCVGAWLMLCSIHS